MSASPGNRSRAAEHGCARALADLRSAIDEFTICCDMSISRVEGAVAVVVEQEIERRVDVLPTTRLTTFGVQVAPLIDAGLVTIGQVRCLNATRLQAIRGIGPSRAFAVEYSVWELVRDAIAAIRLLPDPARQRPGDDELVALTAAVVALRSSADSFQRSYGEAGARLEEQAERIENARRSLRRFRDRSERRELKIAAHALSLIVDIAAAEVRGSISFASNPTTDPAAAWRWLADDPGPFERVLDDIGTGDLSPPIAPVDVFWFPQRRPTNGPAAPNRRPRSDPRFDR